MMGWAAKDVGQPEAQHVARRPRPFPHLVERGRPGAKIERQQFQQRDQLHRAQRHTQHSHRQQPAAQLHQPHRNRA